MVYILVRQLGGPHHQNTLYHTVIVVVNAIWNINRQKKLYSCYDFLWLSRSRSTIIFVRSYVSVRWWQILDLRHIWYSISESDHLPRWCNTRLRGWKRVPAAPEVPQAQVIISLIRPWVPPRAPAPMCEEGKWRRRGCKFGMSGKKSVLIVY